MTAAICSASSRAPRSYSSHATASPCSASLRSLDREAGDLALGQRLGVNARRHRLDALLTEEGGHRLAQRRRRPGCLAVTQRRLDRLHAQPVARALVPEQMAPAARPPRARVGTRPPTPNTFEPVPAIAATPGPAPVAQAHAATTSLTTIHASVRAARTLRGTSSVSVPAIASTAAPSCPASMPACSIASSAAPAAARRTASCGADGVLVARPAVPEMQHALAQVEHRRERLCRAPVDAHHVAGAGAAAAARAARPAAEPESRAPSRHPLRIPPAGLGSRAVGTADRRHSPLKQTGPARGAGPVLWRVWESDHELRSPGEERNVRWVCIA